MHMVKSVGNGRYTKDTLKSELINVLDSNFMVKPENASDRQIYEALASIIVKLLVEKRRKFTNKVHSEGRKQVYYISMEFLMGRSLKTSLYNRSEEHTSELQSH